MSHKTMSRLMRGFLIALIALAALFFFVFLPFYGEMIAEEMPEFEWAYTPCLIWAWCFAVPIFAACVPAWRVLVTISIKGGAFDRKNAKRFRVMACLAALDAFIFPAGMLTIAFMGAGSPILTLIVTPLVIFACLCVCAVCFVMSKLLTECADISEENSLTI